MSSSNNLPVKKSIGRPTTYDPKVCDKIKDMLRQGLSKKEIAYELDINRDTFYQWCEKYPDFADTIKNNIDFSEAWWTKKGIENLHNKDFNSTLWYMNMKNRFGWSDNQTQNINIQVEDVTNKLKEIKEKYGRDY